MVKRANFYWSVDSGEGIFVVVISKTACYVV